MKRIQTDHFSLYQYPNCPTVSGGGYMAFTLSQVDMAQNCYHTNLWVRFPDGTQRQMTDFNEFGAFRWTSDHTLLFSRLAEESDRALAEQGVPLSGYQELDVETGALRTLFTVSQRVLDVQALGADRYLLLCEVDRAEETLRARIGDDWTQFLKEKERESHFITQEETPFWGDSSGYCGGKRGVLFLLEGERLTRLTQDPLHVVNFAPFEDRYAMFCGVDFEGVCPTTSHLYRIDGKTLDITPVPEDVDYVYVSLCPLADGRVIVARQDRRLHGEYQDEYLDLITPETGAYQRLNGDCAFHCYDSVNSDIAYGGGFQMRLRPSGKGVCFLGTRSGSSHLFYGDFETGQVRQLTEPEGKVLDFDLGGDCVWMVAQRGLQGSELYRVPWDGGLLGGEEAVSDWNGWLSRDYFGGMPQRLALRTGDGTELEGWVIRPREFRDTETYPAVFFIHGGPNTAYGPNFIHEMQYLASEGYGIFYCNPRGSVGYGGEFEDIRCRYGTVDYSDMMSFTDAVLAQHPWIDANRLGVTGGSYGGIMTNWIVGHTRRFRAAISDRGNCNCISDFGLSDIGLVCCKDNYGVTPWEDHEALWEASPLKYAPEIKTPLLLVHGEQDYRCTVDHAIQLFTALKYFGTDARLFIMKDSNHGASRSGAPETRVRRLEEMKHWLDRYLIGVAEG